MNYYITLAKPSTNGFLFFFFAGVFGAKTQISTKKERKYKFGEKKEENELVTGWQGVVEHVPNFIVYLQKSAWTLDA